MGQGTGKLRKKVAVRHGPAGKYPMSAEYTPEPYDELELVQDEKEDIPIMFQVMLGVCLGGLCAASLSASTVTVEETNPVSDAMDQAAHYTSSLKNWAKGIKKRAPEEFLPKRLPVDVIFEPGSLGMQFDCRSGMITEVVPGRQAAKL